MQHPVFQCCVHCWLNRVTKLEHTLVIHCNIESVILEFYNGLYIKSAKCARSVLGQRLMRIDKLRGDFIYAWRLSVFALHSKWSEHSLD